ncbi:two-component system response regulator MprA [Cellulosimicrobium cellulans]|uniref:DNA-binding response regulator n=1 Tax=Cellulosimicrobium cellulans TaxID=1710 RepID=A0A1Y0HYV0_CELCE|nr:response regulator transcription factor [Cellulosimicrobium cellulans]ARU53199.1 DNA-binding response regulator [Cellulosimicrobium cellulans]MBM7820003.1 two-component system response regulator MprA [Cellulosimicrobium cellulans]
MAGVGVCEDDPAVRRAVAETLRRADHRVVLAHTGSEAMRVLGPGAGLDVLVIDIGLPDADGRDVCQALRAAGQTAPVLFLTARDTLTDLVSGFSAGGDDYLTKPFAVAELQVRVAALAQRRLATAPTTGLVLDPATFAVRYDVRACTLTPTEFRLLASLTARPGTVVRRRELVAAGWPMGAMVQENTIDSFVRRLRAKLASVGSPVRIETVRGVGYTLR